MEPEEHPDFSDNLVICSNSDDSEEICVSEPLEESHNEDDVTDSEYPLETQPTCIPNIVLKSPQCLQSQEWESACEQQPLSDLSGSEVNVAYREMDIYLSESQESITESPYIKTLVRSLSSHSECLDSEPLTDQISPMQSESSSSSLGCVDMTLALTLTEQPVGASNRQRRASGFGSRGNRRVESSEEGGCSEAPPASVSFGISDESAEQAERRNSESEPYPCRAGRNRARCTRLRHIESQAERHIKETKSKCKHIARLLADAPNPRNKGALLFKKRRQRVKKYTLVSYGTGDYKNQIEEEAEETGPAGYNFVTTSDSELEEEYSLFPEPYILSLNWESFQEMEALPETKGKGVMMFAQRRKRMDEIMSDHEELKNKELPAKAMIEPKHAEIQNRYDTKEMYIHTDQANQNYMDTNLKENAEYHENIQQKNQSSNAPRSLVPNRTAKPFLGSQENTSSLVSPSGNTPVTKKQEMRFKVPVPINSNPHVWSPTGDIIASRHERISVPAIRTGILPEPKRKGTSKQSSTMQQESDLSLQNKGERRSYIEPEPEEDFFSLGAEACNFMQPRAIKLKNPPPVAPKPTINPNCPPWLRRSPSVEPLNLPRSPVSQSSHSPQGSHSQHYLQQQDWTQSQQMANRWDPDQTKTPLQTPTNAWTPVSSSPHLQPDMNSRSQQPQQSPVSTQARSPSYSPHHPSSSSRNKSDSAANSAVSCPPQGGKSYVHTSKASPSSSRGQVSDRRVSQAADGSTMTGRGAELFAKRQSRMEKFVVDAETVQANKPRSPSPTSSLPNTWRYSSNVRAPPPLSYNPLLAPFYPPAAAKKPTSINPQIKAKSKQKPKTSPKHLDTLDIMKHQPYQLDSSLFKYDVGTEAKSPSPKPFPTPKSKVSQGLKHKSSLSHSLHNPSEVTVKSEPPAKSSGLGFGRSHSLMLPRRLNSVPASKSMSPVSTPGSQPSFVPTQRQASWQEKAYKPPTPWEAASRSSIGSVDEAFVFQSLQSSVASNVKSAAQHRSLPEPPDEWKQRVSLDPAAVSKGHFHAAPAFQAPAMSRTFSPEKPAFYGPPFRPAQPLSPASRPTIGYVGQVTSPTKYSSLFSTSMMNAGYRLHTRDTITGDVMDLGKKLSTPKDIMLEELSLLSNRGSRLFKMRQRRSEKYTFESIQNETNMLLNNAVLNENTDTVEINVETPASGDADNPENTAPDVEKLNTTEMPKSYHSPWEEAILNDPALAESFKLQMSGPDPRPELPEYKCFNRVATPYGGFEKAPRGITFKLPVVDLNPPQYPELQEPGLKRPTFNRTAQGWISDSSPLTIPTVTLEPSKVPESDDL
ncbi:hypothetical protein LDENG_00112770 [Lucifuga dentata]|nr:hypothetical protein LDENG_00112770 [Lucifuga dentata]